MLDLVLKEAKRADPLKLEEVSRDFEVWRRRSIELGTRGFQVKATEDMTKFQKNRITGASEVKKGILEVTQIQKAPSDMEGKTQDSQL